MALDYTGQPCGYDTLRRICQRHDHPLVADPCHALRATCWGKRVGAFAEPTAFSFHPAKHITTGEGGMIVTDDSDTAIRMRAFRNHGISTEARARPAGGLKVRDSGPRIQLPPDRLPARPRDEPDREASGLARRRQALAAKYDRALGDLDGITPIAVREEVEHAYHLYVVRLAWHPGSSGTRCSVRYGLEASD